MPENILPILQMILAIGNICVMGYALAKFLNKPHSSLEARVTKIEIDILEIKASLEKGNNRFKEQEDTNQVLLHSVLALIEFEMQYCIEEKHPISEGLKTAKEQLHSYLSKR